MYAAVAALEALNLGVGNNLENLKAGPDLVSQRDQKIWACVEGRHCQQDSGYAGPDGDFQNQQAMHFRPPQAVDRVPCVESAFPSRAG